jgi:superfamily II DNA or RNA helicase
MENNRKDTFLMMIKLYEHQQILADKINSSKSLRNCVQSPTGSGKTIIFSHLANTFIGRVLILVNRTELLEQTKENINRECGLITANNKKIDKTPVTIGMVESVYNRQKKGLIEINDFDLIIVDEIQNLQFTKVFDNYKHRLLGFTATPVIDKKDKWFVCPTCDKKHDNQGKCCGEDTLKTTKKISLKRWYGDLITGTSIENLIELGELVDVRDFVCDTPNLSKLKVDSNGQFTTKSESEVFDNFASLENLILNYKEHCVGLKTMVFNTSIQSNRIACEEFLKLGYNVRSFDSKSKEKRADLVEWFRNTPGSVLMSVGVFTTGFDVKDVEAIIMNRATKSLSLYHQIVGRGGRKSTATGKIDFKFIDLGGNVKRFGSWSEDVDWNKKYNDETQKTYLKETVSCDECGFIWEAQTKSEPCPECGNVNTVFESENTKDGIKKTIAEEVKKVLKPPTPVKILRYAKNNDLDINQAKNVTADLILRMFVRSKTSKETFIKKQNELDRKLNTILDPIYFALHDEDSKIKGNKNRTRVDFKNKVIKRLNKYYE